jgi:hypothetical protein
VGPGGQREIGEERSGPLRGEWAGRGPCGEKGKGESERRWAGVVAHAEREEKGKGCWASGGLGQERREGEREPAGEGEEREKGKMGWAKGLGLGCFLSFLFLFYTPLIQTNII